MPAIIKKYFFAVIICFQCLSLAAKDYPASLFGIRSDGVTLNTRTIQFAIDYIQQQGGGRLVFDVGRFLTGSIHLKSGVSLHLKEGAVLLGSVNPMDYDKVGLTALILCHDQNNIAITGQGVIDGQGREVAKNVIEMVHKGLLKDLFRNDRPEVENRPMLIYFRSCANLNIRGITLRNAAAWVQTYDQCRNLNIDSITVDSRAFWNNDGIDIVDCDSVNIRNSFIDSDDDGICFKSHDPTKVCKNILVRSCRIRSSANAIKFGTASLGGFSNIKLFDIKIYDTYRSAIALEAVDGGFIENVEVDELHAVNTGNGIFLRIGERVSEKRGRLENITIKNFTAEIAANKPDSGYQYEGPVEDQPRNISPAIVIAGLPGSMISSITFSNIEIKHPGGGDAMFAKILTNQLDSIPEKPAAYPEFSMFRELPAWGIYIRHAKNIQFQNLKMISSKKDYRMAIVLDDVHDSRFISPVVQEPGRKNIFFQYKSANLSFK